MQNAILETNTFIAFPLLKLLLHIDYYNFNG